MFGLGIWVDEKQNQEGWGQTRLMPGFFWPEAAAEQYLLDA